MEKPQLKPDFDPPVLVLTTCGDGDLATRLAGVLVKERLVACAQVLAPVRSHYHWQGELCEQSEVPLHLKTRQSLVEPLRERLEALHDYDVPEFLVLICSGASPSYGAWLRQETRK
ncbi:MAG: divalent-cation tolerance protein CutA [bacterium]|nr:divalent-cation tolerance protein CutA [bacterium]